MGLVHAGPTLEKITVKLSQFEFYKTQINQLQAKKITAYLVDKSQWFSIEPLPDDIYELQVKCENTHLVTSFLFRPANLLDW